MEECRGGESKKTTTRTDDKEGRIMKFFYFLILNRNRNRNRNSQLKYNPTHIHPSYSVIHVKIIRK